MDVINKRNRFKEEFKEIRGIARGSFGAVYEVRNKSDNEVYAIKKVPLNDKNNKVITRELDLMPKLESDFIVIYKDFWIENNYYLRDVHDDFNQPENSVYHKSNIYLLHIQMELCLTTLREIIIYLNKNEINDESKDHYFIKCEIFKEILESVNYLHEQRVIHRDLKPENILLTDGKKGRFVKICDFGLAVIHERTLQSHTEDRGSVRYMAPEVIYGGRKYNMRADVYSLGVVIKELYEKEFENYSDSQSDSMIGNKVKALTEIKNRMIVENKDCRPNCIDILNQKNLWALELKEFAEIDEMELTLKSNSVNFKNSVEAVQEAYRKFIINSKLIKKLPNKNQSNLSANATNATYEGINSLSIKNEFFTKEFNEITKMESDITHYFYNKLNQIFENDIKLSFISADYFDIKRNIIIIITKEDKVYEFSRNAINHSLLIFSNNKSIIEQKIKDSLIEELSYKGIVELKNSDRHRMGLTIDGKLYCWGSNLWGVLGNGRSDERDGTFNKPEVNKYLKDKHIIQMSCGAHHSLVLTNEGEVYGWGYNSHGQIGNRNIGYLENQLIPYLVNEFNGEKVISISCGWSHSLALTGNGIVYSWGCNEFGELGRNTGEDGKSSVPKAIELNEEIIIKKICCGLHHSLLLSLEGDIYWFGSYNIYGERREQLLPIKVNKPIKFKDIAARWDFNISCALSTNDVYYVFGRISDEGIIEEPKETEFQSFNEMFIFYKGITYNSIEEKLSKFNDNFIRQGFYEKEFFDCKQIGRGSYGTVFEVKQLNYNKEENFAIKRIELNFSEPNKDYFNETILKELENFSVIRELDSEKLVKTNDLWLENEIEITNNINVAVQKPLIQYVYIKMELCDKTLNDLIEEIKNDVRLIHDNCLTLLGYYTCCNLFIQILEGVHYLHTSKPPIIHRNLTPYNILIKINDNNNGIVKIAGLGLAFLHKYKGQQHTEDIGNVNYAAPEVLISRNYDTRADIFSLGVISKELFLININRDYNENDESSLLMNKYQELSELYDKMTRIKVNKRLQSCQQILNDKNLWALMDNEFNINKEFKQFSDNCDEEYKKSYVYKVIELMTKK